MGVVLVFAVAMGLGRAAVTRGGAWRAAGLAAAVALGLLPGPEMLRRSAAWCAADLGALERTEVLAKPAPMEVSVSLKTATVWTNSSA